MYIHVQYNILTYVSLHTKYVVFTYNSHTYHGPLSLCNGGRGYLVSRAPHIITPSKRHCNCRQRKHLFIPCLAQKSRPLISHIHLLFYMIYIKNKLFYMKTSLTRSLIFHIHLSRSLPIKMYGICQVSDLSYTPAVLHYFYKVSDSLRIRKHGLDPE